mmetsp:Transcript_40297/g.94400  ORF Transcript_40297/g.94400 Transcript_40297/m.94400 type:complete len:330 (+) Transcript_40297:38-1027(+)
MALLSEAFTLAPVQSVAPVARLTTKPVPTMREAPDRGAPSALAVAATALAAGVAVKRRTAVRPADTRAARASAVAMQAGAETGFDLTGKVAIVTGASRGIGAAIAERLAKAGAVVVGTATSDSGAEAISKRFEGDLQGEGMKLDVTDSDNVAEIVKAVTEKYGAPDILVNNAGITKDTLMMRMKEEAWLDVINTNLNSVFRMTKAASKGMTKKRWGRIISISSVVGSMGNVGQSNYAAAKAGMDGWTRAMAREIGSRGITVNSVAPGFIDTDMTADLPAEWKEKLLENVPVKRLGDPGEIADAVLFLASPAAGYITGHTLHVNGGMHMA